MSPLSQRTIYGNGDDNMQPAASLPCAEGLKAEANITASTVCCCRLRRVHELAPDVQLSLFKPSKLLQTNVLVKASLLVVIQHTALQPPSSLSICKESQACLTAWAPDHFGSLILAH
jgi:hypothetical protein